LFTLKGLDRKSKRPSKLIVSCNRGIEGKCSSTETAISAYIDVITATLLVHVKGVKKMRKYRGLTIDSKQWVYGWYCQIEGQHFIIVEDAIHTWQGDGCCIMGVKEVLPETVGQYTGLKDKNGKDLDWYAGDIIQKGEIIRPITVDWEHGMRFMLGKHILCKQDGINGTKIGNIHENPDLLEQGQ